MSSAYKSDFSLGIVANRYQEFIDNVVIPIVEEFISKREDDINFEILPQEKHISFVDFQNKDNNIFESFYLDFLNDIKKEEDKIVFRKKICISFDERLCNELCDITNRRFSIIKIGGVSLVYFIYFDIKEFFDYIYNNIDLKHRENYDSQEYKKSFTKLKKPNLTNILGYIHNINLEKELSFVRTSSINPEEGIVLCHRKFDSAYRLKVGTPIKMSVDSLEKGRNMLISYEECSIEDLYDVGINMKEFVGDFFVGEQHFSIMTSITGERIYLPNNLISQLEKKEYVKRCLAVESYDTRQEKMGWLALDLF